jgi:hypothetical protein
MTIRTSGAVTFANQRRSQRILLAVPLLVCGRHADGTDFAEHASTVIVNASGGLIALKVAVSVAQTLSLKNENTDNDISCAVVNVEPVASMRWASSFAEAIITSGGLIFLPPIGHRAAQKQSATIRTPKPRRRETPPSKYELQSNYIFFVTM